MRPFHLLLASLAVCAAPAAAQVGTCKRGEAFAVLETQRLAVPLRANGQVLSRSGPNQDPLRDRYFVPKRDSVAVVYGADLWLTGYVGGDLRTSAQMYVPGDFWPGPLPDAARPPADCTAYDRIWTVSRDDVARYLRTGEATADLAEWPADLGAPVIDGDGVPGNYDLAAGDQPDLLGDVAAWWVMHDAGNAHGLAWQSGVTDPLGVEVRGHVFAFEAPPSPALPSGPIRDASFFRFEVVNRRAVPIDSLRFSLYVDPDLGGFSDDYVGTDTLRHLAYVYNGDNDDEVAGGFGLAPPAWGVQILSGPVGLPNGRDDDDDGIVDEADEPLRLTTAPRIDDDYGTSYPQQAYQFANVQRGRDVHGRLLAAGGYGVACESADCYGFGPTVFAFPADPARGEFWTEVNAIGDGRANLWGDRYLLLTVGATTLSPGGSAVYDVAMPFAQGDNHLGSVTELRSVANGLQSAFGGGQFPSRRVEGPTDPPLPDARSLARVRPNPGTGGQAAVLSLPEPAAVRAVVLDALGRTVAVVASGTVPAGETTLAVPDGLPPGAYLLRVAVERGRPVAVPFTVLR